MKKTSENEVKNQVGRKTRNVNGSAQQNFSVRIDLDNWEWICNEATRTRRSKGLVINECIRWFIETETARIGQKRLIEATTGTKIKDTLETAEKALQSILRIWNHYDIIDKRWEDEYISDLKM